MVGRRPIGPTRRAYVPDIRCRQSCASLSPRSACEAMFRRSACAPRLEHLHHIPQRFRFLRTPDDDQLAHAAEAPATSHLFHPVSCWEFVLPCVPSFPPSLPCVCWRSALPRRKLLVAARSVASRPASPFAARSRSAASPSAASRSATCSRNAASRSAASPLANRPAKPLVSRSAASRPAARSATA